MHQQSLVEKLGNTLCIDEITEFRYVNGELAGQQNVVPPIPNLANILICSFFEGDYTGAFVGSMRDEIKMYDTTPSYSPFIRPGHRTLTRRRKSAIIYGTAALEG